MINKSNDDIWSSGFRERNDYGPSNKKGYRYKLVVIDISCNIGSTIPFKNKNAQTINDAVSQITKASTRKPNLLERDEGKEYVIKTFNNFLKRKNFKRYSQNTSKRAVFSERCIRTIRKLFTKKVIGRKKS